MKIVLETPDEIEIVKMLETNKVTVDVLVGLMNNLDLDREVELFVLLEDEEVFPENEVEE